MNTQDMWSYIVKISCSIVVMCLFISNSTLGQQTPLFTQISSLPSSFNPGAVGRSDQFRASLIHRSQWTKLQGAPVTSGFMGELSIADNKLGIGINTFRDGIGVSSQLSSNVSASYRIKGNRYHFQFGLNGGIMNIKNNWTDVETIVSSDAAFLAGNEQLRFATLGAGVYIFNKNTFFGFSIPNIPEHKLNTNNSAIIAQLKRHYYTHLGCLFEVSEQLKVKPSLLLKYVNGAPLQTDVNIRVILYDKISFGTGFHSGNGLNILLQCFINESWDIGYSYDMTINRLKSVQSGSHEIVLSFRYQANKRVVHSPRYF